MKWEFFYKDYNRFQERLDEIWKIYTILIPNISRYYFNSIVEVNADQVIISIEDRSGYDHNFSIPGNYFNTHWDENDDQQKFDMNDEQISNDIKRRSEKEKEEAEKVKKLALENAAKHAREEVKREAELEYQQYLKLKQKYDLPKEKKNTSIK